MSNKNTYLFTLTITPVQSFISQSRKTKDLFAGSEILSKLIEKALNSVKDEDIIFPKYTQKDTQVVSNKFVILLIDKTEKEVKELGNRLKECINKTCINLLFEHTKIYDNFFENFFQPFWVAVEYDKNRHKESYKKLEQSLGAVKNLRTFTQMKQEGARKCSLCGERNGTFYKYREDENGKQIKPRYISIKAIPLKENNIQNIDINHIKDNETLCPICFTKRFYTGSYPSTEDISNDNKYYALVQFDIDDMGIHLSNAKDIQAQRDLSEKIGEFSQKAKDIVSKKYTIYAGGDDFLGFVELNNLFSIIKKIKEVFPKGNLTFSTSIVIAHDKAPLHKVLDFSRELLAETKAHFDNKNGVGIVVLSDSAINAKTICRYENLELLKEMKEQKVGMSLHYKLQTLFSYLDNMSYDEFLIQKEMIKVEIKRLLKREDGNFDEKIYNSLIAFFNNQKIERSTNSYEIDLDNFIGYLKTLEQLRKVM